MPFVSNVTRVHKNPVRVATTVSLTGDVTFTTSNISTGADLSLRIVADGSTRVLTFPAGWTFLGTAPTSIAPNKTAILSILAYGATDSTIVAAYNVQN